MYPMTGWLFQGQKQKFFCWGSTRTPSKMALHFDTPPPLTPREDFWQLDVAHVYIQGRNRLILAEETQGNTDSIFLAVKLPLPGRELIANTRPIEIYSPEMELLTKRIYCDFAATIPYGQGPEAPRLFTLWGFILLHPGDSARLLYQVPEGEYGSRILLNSSGELQHEWMPGQLTSLEHTIPEESHYSY